MDGNERASASMLLQQLLELHRKALVDVNGDDPELEALTLEALSLAQDLLERQKLHCAGSYWRTSKAREPHIVADQTAMNKRYMGPLRPDGEPVALCNACGVCCARDQKKAKTK
jgi:hypothetical protein